MSISATTMDALDRIEPLHQVALRVIAITSDPDHDVHDLYQTVSLDQAVTAKVLRLVNSTAFALKNPVDSLEHALRFIGARNLTNMVLTVCSSSVVSSQDGVPPEEKERMWRHAVAVAVASDELARRVEGLRRDLAFTAGLLHDVGRAAIPFSGLVDGGPPDAEDGECWVDRERLVSGCDHDELGGLLLARWKLPEGLCYAVRHHSDPTGDAEDDARLASVIHLAEVRCSGMGMAAFEEGREAPLCATAAHELGLSPQQLAEAWPEIVAKIEKAEGLLNLKV